MENSEKNKKLEEISNSIIEEKQKINKLFEDTLLPAKERLESLMSEAAKLLSPFKEGDIIEFENGKQGQVTNITFYSRDFFIGFLGIQPATTIGYEDAETMDYSQTLAINFLNNELTFTWQIEGVMIKNDGEPGKRKFLPKNPFDNKIEGNKIYERTLRNSLAISEFFHSGSQPD